MKSENEIDVESLIEQLVYWNHHDDKDRKELRKIEKDLNIEYISVDVEKHNGLQYTYYFEIDYGMENLFFVEIENGIMNGTRVNSSEWGCDTKPESQSVEVLKDVVLDKSEYPDLDARRKAQAILNANKQKFFDFHRQNNYDNYVTGGNSQLKMNGLIAHLHVKYIYEDVQADINFI